MVVLKPRLFNKEKSLPLLVIDTCRLLPVGGGLSTSDS